MFDSILTGTMDIYEGRTLHLELVMSESFYEDSG